jgi:predicted transposase/invertase (TIGR01784 family)
MQMFWSETFKSRVLLNASKAYVMQLDKADKISLIRPVYALNFVNETFEKSSGMRDTYFHHYKIVNIANTDRQIRGLEFFFIELPKFKAQNRAERKLHELWLRFLTEVNEHTTEIPADLLANADTREAVGYMERAAYSKEQLLTYDKWKINILTEQGMLDEAKAEGRAEGEAIGIEKGKVEKAVDTAASMLFDGMSAEKVCRYTDLSPEEVEAIIRQLKTNGQIK